jgi:hypothetical protein
VHHLQLELASCQDTCDDLAAAGEIDHARLSATLANVERERDSALTDLASAYSDMQAMQAALLDSALYVRYLRAKLVESKLDSTGAGTRGAWGGPSPLCASKQLSCSMCSRLVFWCRVPIGGARGRAQLRLQL